jgi:hypothetical protein
LLKYIKEFLLSTLETKRGFIAFYSCNINTTGAKHGQKSHPFTATKHTPSFRKTTVFSIVETSIHSKEEYHFVYASMHKEICAKPAFVK